MVLDDTLALLEELIAFPTVSSESNLALIGWAEARLSAIGAEVERTASPCGQKANLFATIGPDVAGGTVLSGHTDVVPVAGQDWSSDPFRAEERAGRIHGRGACDMKGLLAAALALAPRAAAADLKRPLHIALTYDEEVGCLGAPRLIEALVASGRRPRTCILGEPTEMKIINGHKGMCEYTVRVAGLAGHGSRPDLGVSAVEYAVRFAARLLELRAELEARAPAGSPFEPPCSTLQIGRIAGGQAHNVIAERAELDWELRPVTSADRIHAEETMRAHVEDRLLPAMRAVHPGASIETEIIGAVEGLEPLAENEAVALATALTGGNATGVVSFGTEAGLFQQAGIHTVVCGPGSIEQAHKADEYVEIAQLAQCCTMLERLIPTLERA